MHIIREIERVTTVLFMTVMTLFLNSSIALASDPDRWGPPLNIRMSLSANYGELRGERIHAGIDLRLGGRGDIRVLAVDDGYICRVSVSPDGYGNAVFVRHKDGIVSIYAHLSSFSKNIEERIRDKQYEKESYSVSFELSPDESPVEKGDFLGIAGNTGSSGGPHLHLEFRDSLNRTLNPVARNFYIIEDTQAPVIEGVYFYGLYDDRGVSRSELLELCKRETNRTVYLPVKSYMGIYAYDKVNGSPAKLGLRELRIFLDDELLYKYVNREISGRDNRKIRTMLDYFELRQNKTQVVKSYGGSLFSLNTLVTTKNNGIVELNDNDIHTIRIEAEDDYYNVRKQVYTVQRDTSIYKEPQNGEGVFISCFSPNFIDDKNLSIYIPPGAFMSSCFAQIEDMSNCYKGEHLRFSPVWSIGEDNVLMVRQGVLEINVNDVPPQLGAKVLLAKLDQDGKPIYAGGRLNGRVLIGNISSFGKYCVVADTTPPEIIPEFDTKKTRINRDALSFIINDDLSGMSSYRVTIDDQWVLAGYDAKNKRISVNMHDNKVVKRGKICMLHIAVADNRNNVSKFNYSFIW